MMLAPGKVCGQAFLHELDEWGPFSVKSASLTQANTYCEQLAKSHYENFSVASFLVPRRLRQHFYNIYAYCRWSDDLADEVGDSAKSRELLNWWQGLLTDCYAGKVRHPVFVALRSTLDQYPIPIEPFANLLSAFLQDQSVSRYADDATLMDYCNRSANPVGRIILALAKVDDPQCLVWSDHICTGLQRANFCQDVKRDALIDRIYLPQSRWQQFSLDEPEILAGVATSNLKACLQAWVNDTRQLFYAGRPLLKAVPRWLGRDLQLFVRGGLAILDAIEKNKFDVWSKRIELNRWSKLRIVAMACLTSSISTRTPTP
jgi:squalene synthase HpnC